MKKMLAFVLISLLLCGCAALSEGSEPEEGLIVNTLIDEGAFVIQIDVPNGDLGWLADDMSQDDTVVKLAYCDVLEDTFVARYEAVGDGDICVGVRHYIGIACYEAMTWDLHVADGAVQEVIGSSHTVSPDEMEQDPYLCGEWMETQTQFTHLTVEKGVERGWDVVLTSPMTHGAYVFKTTVYYDCELDAFVYDKGKFWDMPADYEEGMGLGEAKIAGTTGSFSFMDDEQGLLLSWYDDQTPDQTITFERATAD